jgi:hypothetical protein
MAMGRPSKSVCPPASVELIRGPHAKSIGSILVIVAVMYLFLSSPHALAYSILAHETIIDSAWDQIRASLLERFPSATPEELLQAKSYAHGGCLIQDLGYYPHANRFFSDLTHYVRSGRFIEALLRDAQDLDEYAFALGALSHYVADSDGHEAVNRAVPQLYPKLVKKYGNIVTYEEDPVAHLKTEFGFDVLQVAKDRYAPDAYHDFIGFEVADSLLQRAFLDTYCIPLGLVFDNLDKAIGSYRYAVRSIVPRAVRVAWVLKKDEIQQGTPGITRNKFLYHMSRASYRKEWGKNYDTPGTGTRVLASIVWLLPKVGPLKALSLRVPTPMAELTFREGFNKAIEQYETLLDDERTGRLDLRDRNLDTGDPAEPGTYFMADQAYANLLNDLAKYDFYFTSVNLKLNILGYYQDPKAPIITKKNTKAWDRLSKQLKVLKSAAPLNSKNVFLSLGEAAESSF